MGIHTSFITKFQNGALTNNIGSDASNKVWHISIKHSGSLIMLSGIDTNGTLYIFAKNSIYNQFTQLFAIIITGYFKAIFPEDENAFYNFARTIYDKGITVCFELVVPKALGQHGGTPNMPYFVVTAITSKGNVPLQRKIWSIGQILKFATIYKLPLAGGAIFTDDSSLHLVEHGKYHWESAQAEEFLCNVSNIHWAVNPQYSLSHTTLQGPICEGFVVKIHHTVAGEVETIGRITNEYMSEMSPIAHLANLYFQALNDKITNSTPQSISTWYHETITYSSPQNIKVSERLNSEVIARLSRSSPMFSNLFHRQYSSQVVLKYYKAGSIVLAQVQIKNDDIFGAISLANPNDELYRGLVLYVYSRISEEGIIVDEDDIVDVEGDIVDERAVAVDAEGDIIDERAVAVDAEGDIVDERAVAVDAIIQMPSCLSKMESMCKLKFLRYITHTFPIRNGLGKITGNCKIDERLVTNFLKNWSIPKQYHSAIREYLYEIYNIFSNIGVESRSEKYLEIVEGFFRSNHPHSIPFKAIFGYSSNSGNQSLNRVSNLFVLDLAGVGAMTFEASMHIIAELFVNSVPALGNAPLDGKCIVMLTKPDENQKKINGIQRTLTNKGAVLLLNPQSSNAIISEMQDNNIPMECIKPKEEPKNPLTVIIFAAVIVAMGKSTISQILCKELPNCKSITKEGMKGPIYENRVLELSEQANLEYLILEKNQQDKNSFDATLQIVAKMHRDVRLVTIVPENIESLLPTIYERIQSRTGKSPIDVGGSTFIPNTPKLEDGNWQQILDATFVTPAINFLLYFKRLNGAIILDFGKSASEISEIIIDKILSNNAGASFSDITAPKKQCSYIGVDLIDIVGDFHITLHHMSSGEPPANVMRSIGIPVTIVASRYVRAMNRETRKKISLWVVDEIKNAHTEELLKFPHSELFHITDQAALRNNNSASAVAAKEVMAELREIEDPANIDKPRPKEIVGLCDNIGNVYTNKWQMVIIPSFVQANGIIKEM